MPTKMSNTITPDGQITDAIMNSDHAKTLLGWGGKALQILYALVTLAAMAALIINITKLATSSGNPQGRSIALRNILISGVCLAVLGSLGLIYAVFVSLAIG